MATSHRSSAQMPLPFIYVEFFFRDLGTCAMWDLSFLKSNVEKGKVPIGFFFFFPHNII